MANLLEGCRGSLYPKEESTMRVKRLDRRDFLRLSAAATTAAAVAACAPATPIVVEKEVIREVPVEKAVVVEKEVVKEVPKEIVKEVPVEKEVIKEVEKQVVVTPTPVKATINFAFHGGTEELDMYTKTVEDFNKRDPNITVNAQHIPSDEYKQKVETMIAAGTPPDVFWLHANYFAKFEDAAVLKDLKPFIERDQYPIDAFYETAVGQFSAKGKVLGIPRETSSIVVVYNKNLFDEAGLDYPTEDWTFDDMLEMAKALTKQDAQGNVVQFGMSVPLALGTYMWPTIWSFGGEVLNRPEKDKCMLTKPETIEALQWLSDMVNVHKVAPAAAELASQGPMDLFISNKLAMAFIGRWDVASVLRADPNFNMDIQHVPTGSAGKVTRLSSGAYAITAGSKYPEAAWEFIKYLTGRPVYDFFAAGGLIIPAYIPAATGKAFLDPTVPPAHSQIFLDALEYARSEPLTTNYPEIMDVVRPEIEAVMLGHITAQEAAEKICPKVDELLAQQ
jgi:multiple sugar transport system substrate-binding protein